MSAVLKLRLVLVERGLRMLMKLLLVESFSLLDFLGVVVLIGLCRTWVLLLSKVL